MKLVSNAFKTRLGGDSENLALCVRIVRKDGQQYGFTTWDQEFSFEFLTNPDDKGAITYYPQGSFTPSDISSTSNLGVDSLEIAGVLSSESLSSEELALNMFQDSEVTFFRVDPEHLNEGEMIDKRGYIGRITLTEDTYLAEILSVSSFVKRNVGSNVVPTCPVKRFCNAQCKLIESNFTYDADVHGTVLPRDTTFDLTITGTLPANSRWTNGIVRVNHLGVDFEREIRSVTNSVGGRKTVNIREAFGFSITGKDVEIIEGCDRKISTCISLGNVHNFRGHPHLPGTNQLIQIGRPPE